MGDSYFHNPSSQLDLDMNALLYQGWQLFLGAIPVDHLIVQIQQIKGHN